MDIDSRPSRLQPLNQLHDLLCNKGEYLFQDGRDWHLAGGDKHQLVQIITLKPSDGVWSVPDIRQAIYLFIFDLKRADLTEDLGRRVVEFLRACRGRDLTFRITRPIPPEILPNDVTLEEFSNPTGCEQCLELFRIGTNGDTFLCDGSRLKGFVFTRDGRKQFFNYLGLKFGDDFIRLGNGEESALRMIRSLACTERTNSSSATRHVFDFAAYWISKVGWDESEHLRHCIENYGHRLVDGPVLDNGGGHGKDSFFIKRQGFDPILIDLNSDLLKYAYRRCDQFGEYFPIIHCDATGLPFRDATCSGVYSGGVMHHKMTRDGVQQYLNEASRVLRPGGLFFGNVWARWDGESYGDLFLLEEQDKLEEMFDRAGLHPIKPIETHTTLFEKHKHMWCFVCEKAFD